MKKITYLFALLAIMVMASCGDSHVDTSKLVPDDAFFVARIDLMQAGEASGISNNDRLIEQLKKEMKKAHLPEDLREKIEEIIDSPSESGIDLTEPVYIYCSLDKRANPKEAGLVGSVSDDDKLAELLQVVADEANLGDMEEEDGVKYLNLKAGAVIFTDNWFFAGATEDVKKQIDKLKDRFDGNGSLEGNEAFTKLCEKKGLVQTLFLGSGLKEMKDIKEADAMLPNDMSWTDVAAIVSLSAGNGETAVSAEFVPLSDEWKDLLAELDKNFGAIDKTMARYISDEGLAAFANLNGKSVAKLMSQVIRIMPRSYGDDDDSFSEMDAIIKRLCNCLEGPMIVGMPDMADEEMPNITAYINTKDNTIVDFLLEQSDSDEVREESEGCYAVPVNYDYSPVYDQEGDLIDYNVTPSQYMRFGYRNNKTYFVTGDVEPFDSPSKAFDVSKLKGKGIYAYFNFKFLNAFISDLSSSDRRIAEEVLESFDFTEFYYDGDGKFVLRVVTKSKDTNPLKVIMDMASEQL